MEDALRELNLSSTVSEQVVLILVLMEDALRGDGQPQVKKPERCLNPCSNGRCSASFCERVLHIDIIAVLILVLMEDALRVYN